MSIFVDLPIWAVLLLCLLIAAVLTVQNLGWLLSIKAMRDRQRRKSRSALEARPRRTREPRKQFVDAKIA
jgi:hypothetical protein